MEEDTDEIQKQVEELGRRLVKASITSLVDMAQSKRASGGGGASSSSDSKDDMKGYAPPNDSSVDAPNIFARVVRARNKTQPNPHDMSDGQLTMLAFPNHRVMRELLLHQDRDLLIGMNEDELEKQHQHFFIHPDYAANLVANSLIQ